MMTLPLSMLMCMTFIVNHTNVWTKEDVSNRERAQKRCSQLYKKSPCLKQFIKKSERNYHAVCGKQYKSLHHSRYSDVK
jgi:hypothetical protein